jgi:hypothetical protein
LLEASPEALLEASLEVLLTEALLTEASRKKEFLKKSS